MTHFLSRRSKGRKVGVTVCATLLAIGLVALLQAPPASSAPECTHPQSIGVLTFGPDGTLFLADPAAGRVFAYPMKTPATSAAPAATNVHGLDARLATALGVLRDNVSVTDLAVHPSSREFFVGVMNRVGARTTPALFRVSHSGEVTPIDLTKAAHTTVALEGVVEDRATFWGQTKVRSLAITAMAFAEGHLYVAGLSNTDFSSTVWNLPYPFAAKAVASKVEMYHAVHDQNETRAPIRSMTTLSLGGKPHLLATYLCTPLVTIPLEAMQKSGKVKGKTIAELGWGNSPIDLVHFHAQNQEGKQDLVMITNRHRNAMLMNVADIEKAQALEGLSKPSGFSTAGVEPQSIPMASILHLANQDDQFLVTLRRDLDTGRLDLLSYRKAAYMRISDFISEYNFPNYAYPTDGSQAYVKQFQDLLKRDEGFAK